MPRLRGHIGPGVLVDAPCRHSWSLGARSNPLQTPLREKLPIDEPVANGRALACRDLMRGVAIQGLYNQGVS